MSQINKDDFLATLRKSNILAPETLQAWLDENPTTDGQHTALELSKAGLITRWQAKYLLAGRHLLRIGNYVLLERLSQDDLGDLFIANHESLDRKVQIQFLATDLKTGTPQCDQFLQRVGKVSELDHPNLIHLYDVDQEKGRYYVVTEFFPGQTLSDVAGTLDSATLARVLLQVTDALEFLHHKQITHGSVSANEVTISANNEVKLGGLALAPLRSGNAESPSSDYEQLGELASNAFRQLPITEQTGRLESLVAGIGSDFSSPEETRQGLMAYLNHPSQIAPADDIPEGISLEDSPEDNLAVAPQVESPSGAQPVQAGNRTLSEVSNKPYLILGAAILLGVVILGATIFIAMSLSGNVEVAQPSPYKPGNSRRAIKERDSEDELKAGVLDAPPASPFIVKQETIPTQGATDAPPAKPTTDAPPAKPATDPPPAKPATDLPPAKPATDLPPAKPATDPPPAKPADPPQAATPPAKSTVGNQGNPQKPAPFANLPRYFDIPIHTDEQAVSLGKIKPNPKFLLGVKLISGPEISKSKLFFDLQPNHTKEARQWDILYKNRETDTGVPVAKFIYQGNDFRFQWYPAAADDKNVNYLKNCVVKFEVGSNRDERVLRKPFHIRNFKLAADNPEVKADAEVAWLPNPKFIKTELGSMAAETFGKNFFANPLIAKKTPVRIAFSDIDYEQMSSILLTADVRSKIKLSATLQVHALPGQKPKLGKPSLFDSTALALQQNATLLQQRHQQFSGAPIAQLRKLPNYQTLTDPQKKQLAARMKQEADVALEKSKKFVEQKKNSVDKFYGKVIPITISYQMGNRVIPLATTKSGQ